MTVPTPPNTDALGATIEQAIKEHYDKWGWYVVKPPISEAEYVAQAVRAVPSVASALTLRQTVIDEPDWDRVGGWGAECWNAGVTAHNEAFARLRAVVEETPQ